jgi:glycerol uptake facilitator protein
MMTLCAFDFMSASYMGRGFAHFVGFLIAVSTSGAHFNPATSLAVYLAEGKYARQIIRLIVYYIAQVAGAFAGVLLVYLIFNSPFNGYLLWP